MNTWNVEFLTLNPSSNVRRALIILNQPFPLWLLRRLWNCTQWHCCADGGANRLYDILGNPKSQGLVGDQRELYLPDLIKGDLDSIRDDVRRYYIEQGIPALCDEDQDSTDLMKCVAALHERERVEGLEYELIVLGGLTGRLDQTIHTLSYLHKLRKIRKKVYAITDENVGWVLDSITVLLGKTCGLLPIGVDSTVLSTTGLEWNLVESESSFDGMVSTSNHLVPGQNVWIKTTKPIWWTVELRPHDTVEC
ncbi:thiamine pyrophosphokinase Thi80 [Amanita rubescens]|nr:thiamine pyrophosphokinase Thi80 [Amanita rubescens]